MQPEIKSIGMVVKAVASEDTDGEFEAILSTSQVDRDGETVQPLAFSPVPKSIPIFYAHDWQKGALPIGVGEPYYEGDVLKIRGRYAPTEKAQEVRALVTGGFVGSMSAGFLTKSRKGKSISAAELLEGSMTPLPVNSGALVLASKAMGDRIPAGVLTPADVKAGARNNSDDKKRIQAMHNLASELGASCASDSGAGDVKIAGGKSVKSIVGTVEALQDRVRDALDDAYGEWSTVLRGVDPTSGVVYFDRYATPDDGTFSQAFTDDGSVVTLDGDATEVDVHEIVVPDADADRENKSLPTAAAPGDAADTKSAAPPAAATVDEEAALLALKAEALALVAHTAAL